MEADAHLRLGNLSAFRSRWEQVQAHLAVLVEADPTNTEWQRDLSVSHEKLGDLAQATGDLPTATTHYNNALTIASALTKADPTNTEWQRDLSVSHNKLGDLAQATGDLPTATTHYNNALTIALGTIDQALMAALAVKCCLVTVQRGLMDEAVGAAEPTSAAEAAAHPLLVLLPFHRASPDQLEPFVESIAGDRSGEILSAVSALAQSG